MLAENQYFNNECLKKRFVNRQSRNINSGAPLLARPGKPGETRDVSVASSDWPSEIQAHCQCPVHWEQLPGDGRTRWSAMCGHHIYDPTGLSREEVLALVRFHEGASPKNFRRRADGMLTTAACRRGYGQRLRSASVATAGMIGYLAILVCCINLVYQPPSVQATVVHEESPAILSPVNHSRVRKAASGAGKTTIHGTVGAKNSKVVAHFKFSWTHVD
jgi:hypothetical protein